MDTDSTKYGLKQNEDHMERLKLIKKIIFDLNEENITESSQILTRLLNTDFPYSSKLVICQLVLSSIKSQRKNSRIYINFLNEMKIVSEFKDFAKSNNIENLYDNLIRNGINPNEIEKAIRFDDVEKLQNLSSQPNFNFSQNIAWSPEDVYSCVIYKSFTLINYAAFFGSVKCFKYLLLNGANVKETGKYAIAGGNVEIFHLCEQQHIDFKWEYEPPIEFHRNDFFIYLYLNHKLEFKNLEWLGEICVRHYNYKLFSFLQKEGMRINDAIINTAARTGNIFLILHFLKDNKIPKNIMFHTVVSNNIELVKYILKQEGIDINTAVIYLNYYILNNNFWN